MRRLAALLAIASATGAACSPSAAPPVPSSAAPAVAPAAEASPGYRVTKFAGDDQKDNWHVELDRKPNKEQLRALSLEIRNKNGTGAPRAYIWFHLMGNPPSNPWAQASFNPDPQVEIRGLTAEEEAALVSKAPAHDQLVGRWVEDDMSRHLLTIYRDSGRIYLATAGGSGDESTDELVEDGAPEGRRFRRREPSQAGDHYVINERGDLEMRDDQGLHAVAHRIGAP